MGRAEQSLGTNTWPIRPQCAISSIDRDSRVGEGNLDLIGDHSIGIPIHVLEGAAKGTNRAAFHAQGQPIVDKVLQCDGMHRSTGRAWAKYPYVAFSMTANQSSSDAYKGRQKSYLAHDFCKSTKNLLLVPNQVRPLVHHSVHHTTRLQAECRKHNSHSAQAQDNSKEQKRVN